MKNNMSKKGSEVLAELARKRFTKHGHATRDGGRSAEYRAWASMLSRCYKKKHKQYPNYGKRGIKVCKKWRESFLSFLADMKPRPAGNYSLDRIDNDGNYAPANCRWATAIEQQQNRRVNRLITYNGVTLCAAEWARRLGVTRTCINHRLNLGWSSKKIVTTPSRKTNKKQLPDDSE
jgi:hypothetical protein